MAQKRRTMLTAIRPAIILPFFLSRAKLHIPSRRIPPVLKRAGCAWFICQPCCPCSKAVRGDNSFVC